MSRKYLPTLAELVDRLSIVQLKEVFITEHKKEYAKEIKFYAMRLVNLFNLHICIDEYNIKNKDYGTKRNDTY